MIRSRAEIQREATTPWLGSVADEFTVLLEDIKDPSDVIEPRSGSKSLRGPTHPERTGGIYISQHRNCQHIFSKHSRGLAARCRYRHVSRESVGKARCEVFDVAMHQRAVDRLNLETDLRNAVDRDEFRVPSTYCIS